MHKLKMSNLASICARLSGMHFTYWPVLIEQFTVIRRLAIAVLKQTQAYLNL